MTWQGWSLLALAFAARAVHVYWYPFADHGACDGKGKHRSRKGKGKSFRRCKGCKGRGSYLRWTVRLTARGRQAVREWKR